MITSSKNPPTPPSSTNISQINEKRAWQSVLHNLNFVVRLSTSQTSKKFKIINQEIWMMGEKSLQQTKNDSNIPVNMDTQQKISGSICELNSKYQN